VGAIPLALVGRIFALSRYGNLLLSGKKVEQLQLQSDPLWTGLPSLPPNYPLNVSPSVGFLGPLWHPAKSLFLYDPLLLPCAILAFRVWRQMKPVVKLYAIANLLNLLLHLVAYSRFAIWNGEQAWAARYHITSVQLLLIPLVAYLVQTTITAKGWQRWGLQSLISIAIAVQIASVMMPFNLEIVQKEIGVPGSQYELRLASRFSNILCHFNPKASRFCQASHVASNPTLAKYDRLSFFPFNYQHKYAGDRQVAGFIQFAFIFWSICLGMALLTTILYVGFPSYF
jgi:hypothetical protein